MPIVKERIGNREATVVRFGTGDIAVFNAQKKESSAVNQVWLVETPVNHGVGNNISFKGLNTDQIDIQNEPVVLMFQSATSAQIVIDYIENIRDSLLTAGAQ